MMTPTRRGIALVACGVPVGAAAALINPDLWTLALNVLAATLGLIGVDAVLTPPGRRLVPRISVPSILGIGETGDVTLAFPAFGRGPTQWVSATYDRNGPAPRPEPISLPLDARRQTRARLEVTPSRRGEVTISHLWLRWTGPFGLIQATRRVPVDNGVIRVIPNVAGASAPSLLLVWRDAMFGTKAQTERGDGAEFEALRDHQQGDDLRFVDWKRSARHGKLVAKEFRAERNHHVIFAIDSGRLMSDPIDGIPRLDHAVSASLTLGCFALSTGDLVGLFAFDSAMRLYLEPQRSIGSWQILRHFSAEIGYSESETNYTLAIAELANRLARRALVVVFTDFVDTVTAELLVENIGRLGRRHLVVFVTFRDPGLEAVEGTEPSDLVDAGRVVVTRGLVRERAVVLKRLERIGVDCLEVAPGDLSIKLLNTYLRIKQQDRL